MKCSLLNRERQEQLHNNANEEQLNVFIQLIIHHNISTFKFLFTYKINKVDSFIIY